MDIARIALKSLLIGFLVLIAWIGLNGCTLMPPSGSDFKVTLSPSSGHPPFTTKIQATDMGGGTYTYKATGKDIVQTIEHTLGMVVSTWPWSCTVTWTDGKGTVLEETVRVNLENEIPVAHSLWTIPRNYEDRALILIDLRYLEHGCEGGAALSYSGFEDPEGDTLWYRVLVEDTQTGEWEGVFYGPYRTLMGDEFVSGTIFYWFVNYTGEEPIIPYEVWSPLPLLCCVPTPSPFPGGGITTREKRIHIYVLEVECSSITHWVYDILTAEPRC